jgi:hypothetical protein
MILARLYMQIREHFRKDMNPMNAITSFQWEMNYEARLWSDLLRELLMLSRLYRNREDGRRILYCESLIKSIEGFVAHYGKDRQIASQDLLKEALGGSCREDLVPDRVMEASGWWEAFRHSYRLAGAYGLCAGDPGLALLTADIHRNVRKAIECVFPDAVGEDLMKMATGESGPFSSSFEAWVVHHFRIDVSKLNESKRNRFPVMDDRQTQPNRISGPNACL